MIEVIETIKSILGEHVCVGLFVTLVCYLCSYCLRGILTKKIVKNKYTNLIPVFSACFGVVVMLLSQWIFYHIKSIPERMFMGAEFGLAAVGLHQLIKRIKSFFKIKNMEKEKKINSYK